MILIALAVLAANPPAASANRAPAVLAADPASFYTQLSAARPGDTIRLVPGQWGMIYFKGRNFDPPVTVDASAVTVAGVQVQISSGIRWTGGSIRGNPAAPAGYGFNASNSTGISVEGVHFSNFRVGVVYDRVAGGTLSGNWLTRMTSDGMDFASSRGLTIANNACSEFTPPNGAHPDCIQLWSRPGEAPVADIRITGNSAVGTMQGISLFDYKDGAEQGGFDRVTISNNTVLNTFGGGIGVYNCRNCIVHNNSVGSLPNYMNRAQLYIWAGSVDQCGNTVTMVPRQGTPPCNKGG